MFIDILFELCIMSDLGLITIYIMKGAISKGDLRFTAPSTAITYNVVFKLLTLVVRHCIFR